MVVLSTGFALFSMFFGSGNLIFPINVGVESEGHYIVASLGILATCVIFPLLGMIGMMLYKGNVEEFFSCFGKKGVLIFSFLALALMGPFGVLARCLTVIHGALLLLFPTSSLGMTSFFMCILIFLLTVNKNRIVTVLGSYLTPFLLLSIGAIVFFSLFEVSPVQYGGDKAFQAFTNGFFTGYQTMDLVASFFFSGFVIKHLYDLKCDEKKTLHLFLKSSVVGAFLLYLVYFALVLLGSLYAPHLESVAKEEMFGRVALYSLGNMGAPLVSLTVVFACLTTAIALTSMFAEFLKKEVTKDKLNHQASLLITLAIAFFVSNLEFSGIASFLGPILEAIYPALISLTIVNITCKIFDMKASHWPFTLTLATKLCMV